MPAPKIVETALAKEGRQTSILINPVVYHHQRLLPAAGQVYESKRNRLLPSGHAMSARNYEAWPMLSTVITNPTTAAAADAADWEINILSAVTQALPGPSAPSILVEIGPVRGPGRLREEH